MFFSKWVLIAVFATSDKDGGKGFSFQEFNSKETCEAAITSANEMAKLVYGNDSVFQFQLRCVKK
ncbi:MAG: hypothetical protein JWQ01_3091 [Massilia sp.]|nr:hypothetical protein [Massilia sp.]